MREQQTNMQWSSRSRRTQIYLRFMSVHACICKGGDKLPIFDKYKRNNGIPIIA